MGKTERRAATDLGVRVMELFARPGVEADTWWEDLEPHLSAQARHDYAYVDPRNVPASNVTGTGDLVTMDSPRVAIVHVPTDAGLYAVTLSRSPAEPEWVAERITPPEDDPHGVGEDVGAQQ